MQTYKYKLDPNKTLTTEQLKQEWQRRVDAGEIHYSFSIYLGAMTGDKGVLEEII